MLFKLLSWQQSWASKKVLLVFVLVYFIFPFYLLPKILPQGQPLDLYLYYTPVEAYSLIDSYGEENRRAYALGSATIDMLYPLCYSTFLGLVLTFFIVRCYHKDSKIHWFRLFPYSLMVADFFENICIIAMLTNFPEKLPKIALLSGLLTLTKWLLFFIVLLMLVYFLIHYYWYKKSHRVNRLGG